MAFVDSIQEEVAAYRGQDAELVQLAPRLFKALANLLDDPSLGASMRVQVAAAMGYFVAPFDAVPDTEGGGWLDDVFVALHVLRVVHDHAGDSTLDIAWPDQNFSGAKLVEWYDRTRAALHGQEGAALGFVGLAVAPSDV
jgi:uncharacterized membrane protein YkvA (DUF1232 family)